MESMGLNMFEGYRGRRVLITGHTGFKGSWLSLWLEMLGARVSGIALAPETDPSHWGLLGLDIDSALVDIRDYGKLRRAVTAADPEIIFHLAAQPLVRQSYLEPLATWQTNVMGTANLLEAARSLPELRAIVVATTDKCYENRERDSAYRESDPLGGHDPYSASKAGAELVAASYRRSFFSSGSGPLLATARAGNVIGGGDWAKDRLVPDLVRSLEQGRPLVIRYPEATRPWQHVLDSLSGYLMLGQRLLAGEAAFAEAWNFGSDPSCNRTVNELLQGMQAHWRDLSWEISSEKQPHESTLLQLDSGKSRERLGWRPAWALADTLRVTAQWYRRYHESREVASAEQVLAYSSQLERAAGEATCA